MNLGNRHSQHSFAQIPSVKMARSQFDRSFTAKDTFFFDRLTPCFVDEILPGDTVNLNMASFIRLSSQALKVPPMDNMYVDFFFFFVPNRLVWDNWEKFNGAQSDPGDSTDYLIPTITAPVTTGFEINSVFDKMGLPTGVPGIEINALPFRAYNLIYNDWFRDQNLLPSLDVPKDDGPDLYNEYPILTAAKKHDYFTSCLPWPQKGPAVELPLGTSAPVLSNNARPNISSTNLSNVGLSVDGLASIVSQTAPPGQQQIRWGNETGMFANLSDATAATINQLRQAFSVQSIYELDARGGTRYVEILLAHFNVTSPDFRLQRPEFLSSSTVRINAHPVAQTAPTSGSNAQGQLAAFATGSSQGSNVGFTKSFVEHGYVLGLMRARADITYQQGVDRMWYRESRFDFFWPKLQEIGEQGVYNGEIYATGTATDKDIFGYQERFAEYRYKPSQIRGEFRSTYAQSLDVWHLAEEFTTTPALNGAFIFSNTPIDRVLAFNTGPDLLIDMWFQYKHARPMMSYSVPSTLGRF